MNPIRLYPLILIVCVAVALAVALVPLPAGAAPRHVAKPAHGEPVAACEARIEREWVFMLRPSEIDPPGMNRQGDYRFMVWAEQEQRCHHRDMGLDNPRPVVIEVETRATITVER